MVAHPGRRRPTLSFPGFDETDDHGLARGVRRMRLNPPTVVIFLISFVLASLALITKLGFIPVPRYLPHQEFWLSITAYLTLMVGNLVRGL
jgi:hypothetical protein